MEDTNKHINRISRQLISYFREQSKESPEQIDAVWKQIQEKSGSRKIDLYHKRWFWFSISAAVVLTIVIFRHLSTESLPKRSILYELAATQTIEETEDITLFIAQKDAVILPHDTVLSYSTGMQADLTATVVTEDQLSDDHQFDRVIVPRGKRLQLVLSDNSRMWVNSGTRVIYPRVFTGDTRELYVEGEIYLEVEPDKKRPFIVRSNQFEVEVLGTVFNMCAYSDFAQSVVLVEGSVEVTHTNGDNVLLKPDQQVKISPEGAGIPEQVNVADHVSWTQNLLILRGEALETVIRKLRLYYGAEFILDGDFKNITFSGKLDLQDDIVDIIHAMTVTAPINYQRRNGQIVITNK